jgi:hypothetical protein
VRMSSTAAILQVMVLRLQFDLATMEGCIDIFDFFDWNNTAPIHM